MSGLAIYICIGGLAVMKVKTPALMLQGTSSHAGKSVLAAAFCRLLQQDGYAVAPFKAQNMSLNSGVTLAGEEMGRAQIVQAQAARIDPDARMNPVLLKPHSDTGSQVVVLGKAIGHMRVKEYFAKKKELWHTVTKAYDDVAKDYDVMVLEGAGSPAEINLKEHDIVNMRMAMHAKADVLLVGDIDRGGVYASFLGTWHTFTPEEKKLLKGYVVNRFRGDASYLASAHDYMLEHTQVSVLGTIPYIRDIQIPEEDMAGFTWARHDTWKTKDARILDIGVIMLRHVSNYTDLAPLMYEADVRVRPILHAEDFGEPDVLILPGSKSVVADLADLRSRGLAPKIADHAARHGWIFGICGGLQMMGKEIRDPYGIETQNTAVQGLGLMDICSTFAAQKTLIHVASATTPLGVLAHGYEIHHGITTHGASAEPLFLRNDTAHSSQSVQQSRICGYVTGNRYATYLHGIFDADAFRRAFIDHVRAQKNMPPSTVPHSTYNVEQALDALADVVRSTCDIKTIYKGLGLTCKS